MDLPQKDRQCELLPLLAGVGGWIKYRSCWHARHPEWSVVDRHHVFGQRWHDEPWNLVLACRPAHTFCEEAWQQAGQVVCMLALHRSGRFDPAAVRDNIKPDPLWQVEHWLCEEKLFDKEPALKLFAMELLDFYGRLA